MCLVMVLAFYFTFDRAGFCKAQCNWDSTHNLLNDIVAAEHGLCEKKLLNSCVEHCMLSNTFFKAVPLAGNLKVYKILSEAESRKPDAIYRIRLFCARN